MEDNTPKAPFLRRRTWRLSPPTAYYWRSLANFVTMQRSKLGPKSVQTCHAFQKLEAVLATGGRWAHATDVPSQETPEIEET
ncbi:uncharacterized protein LOC111463801 isoform X5 [Cucurbita moschata]|uniref:Uncharacterized protein LOC111463801 isoform X5 n=1 Tax=Cucurbita moschata TaxID=3662 RepID=A0A6J1HFD6_CUCMO|nr:uncharacterized protein LOC111463801 isoform X5 [Cucurbita moschata]